ARTAADVDPLPHRGVDEVSEPWIVLVAPPVVRRGGRSEARRRERPRQRQLDPSCEARIEPHGLLLPSERTAAGLSAGEEKQGACHARTCAIDGGAGV